MYITGYCRMNSIEFDECRIHLFFTVVGKVIHIPYGLRGQIIKSDLVSKRFVQFISNAVCIFCIPVTRIALILGGLKFIVLSQESKK